MGGGVVLLSVMSFFYSIEKLIPIHGVIQLGNNGWRILFLRRYLRKTTCLSFGLGASLGSGLIYFLLKFFSFPEVIAYWGIFILICYSLFRPKSMPRIQIAEKNYFWVGLVAGLFGPIIGSVGPFLAAFFLRDDFSKQEIVANKSFMQAFIHLLKLPIFLSLGFSFGEDLMVWVPMIIAGLVGTKVGIALLKNLSAKWFQLLFKGALAIGAMKLGMKAIEHSFFH